MARSDGGRGENTDRTGSADRFGDGYGAMGVRLQPIGW